VSVAVDQPERLFGRRSSHDVVFRLGIVSRRVDRIDAGTLLVELSLDPVAPDRLVLHRAQDQVRYFDKLYVGLRRGGRDRRLRVILDHFLVFLGSRFAFVVLVLFARRWPKGFRQVEFLQTVFPLGLVRRRHESGFSAGKEVVCSHHPQEDDSYEQNKAFFITHCGAAVSLSWVEHTN
jgi:hypothetical protein